MIGKFLFWLCVAYCVKPWARLMLRRPFMWTLRKLTDRRRALAALSDETLEVEVHKRRMRLKGRR